MALAQKTAAGIERIKGPNLAVLVKRANGVPMEEALRRADEAGLVIASNKRLSKALVGSEEWRSIRAVFPCWSGTMTAYDGPDQELGKTIEYAESKKSTRFVFPVPEEHQGKKNIILVAEHPNFRLVKDGNDRIVQAMEVGVVERFPTSVEGLFLGDPKYDVPQGNEVDSSNQDARYHWRIYKRVGLVARGDGYWNGGYYKLSVCLGHGPSLGFGVAVEAASGGAQFSVREENGKLIVEGTPEQISAAARLLEQLKVGK